MALKELGIEVELFISSDNHIDLGMPLTDISKTIYVDDFTTVTEKEVCFQNTTLHVILMAFHILFDKKFLFMAKTFFPICNPHNSIFFPLPILLGKLSMQFK